jgi:hypothetical protein
MIVVVIMIQRVIMSGGMVLFQNLPHFSMVSISMLLFRVICCGSCSWCSS